MDLAYDMNGNGFIDGDDEFTYSISNPYISYRYDAFGNKETTSHALAIEENNINYCGEYQDEETGLIYLRNRYYDPEIGRFITEDPARDGENWYVYCGNNPVMFGVQFGYSLGTRHFLCKNYCDSLIQF